MGENEEVRPEDVPEGAIEPDDLVDAPDSDTDPEPDHESDSNTDTNVVPQSLAEVVDAVNQGKFGHGQERRRRLSEAGFNPNEVQAEIVRRANTK